MKKHVITKTFGKFVLDDNKLKKFMNIFDFYDYKKIKNEHKPLNEKIAKSIAKAMKTWAMKNGATHFSHWFLPLTGKTAETTGKVSAQKSGTSDGIPVSVRLPETVCRFRIGLAVCQRLVQCVRRFQSNCAESAERAGPPKTRGSNRA